MPNERTCSKCAKLGRSCIVVAVNNMPKLDLERMRDLASRKRSVKTNVVKSRSLRIDSFDEKRSGAHTSSSVQPHASTSFFEAPLCDVEIETGLTWYKPTATSGAARDGVQVSENGLEPWMSAGWEYPFDDISILPTSSDTILLHPLVNPCQSKVEQWLNGPLQATSGQKGWEPANSTYAFTSASAYAWPVTQLWHT